MIECADTWLLRGISEQNVDDWGLARVQQTPSMNASEQSCSNIKCDAIFMLQFLEIKSTAWLRSVSFIHIRFEKNKNVHLLVFCSAVKSLKHDAPHGWVFFSWSYFLDWVALWWDRLLWCLPNDDVILKSTTKLKWSEAYLEVGNIKSLP